MIELKLSEAAHAMSGQLNPSQSLSPLFFTGISLDSRTIKPGNLFIAIRGKKSDGHDFVEQASQQGASALLTEKPLETHLPQILVSDTTQALGELARYWRSQFKLPVLGITGSAGKTTTKQMAGAILSQQGKTLISQGNLNNQYGVPLTLCQLNAEHQFAVIEMGADRKGDIRSLAQIVQPTVGIITNVAAVHLDVAQGIGFQTIEGVFEEKSELFRSLPPQGMAIVNAEDPFFPLWKTLLADRPYLTFGLNPPGDFTASALQANARQQYALELNCPLGKTVLQLSAIGKHNILNALSAAAAGYFLGASLDNIREGLENVPTVAGRMLYFTGKQGALILDDSYNANVKSVPAVMETLAAFEGKKILVLGDMLELGKASQKEHALLGEKAKKLGIDYLLGYGHHTLETVTAFGSGGQYFTDQALLVEAVLPLLDDKTVIAVKGSRKMKMENIVSALQ